MIDGIVEIFKGDTKLFEESNMILDNMGELIADVLSMPRELYQVANPASAILDTSNYTVRAASLGKDALGYSYHAHLSSLPLDGDIRVISYSDFSMSSYITSAFALGTGTQILPEASDPEMTRLESGYTGFTVEDKPEYDYGHNVNLVSEFNGSGVRYGCYAPSGSFDIYLLGPAGQTYASATLTNVSGHNCYDTPSAIDKRGFIALTVTSMVEGAALEAAKAFKGLLLSNNPGWSSGDLQVRWVLGIYPQDLIVLNAYGGIYNIGLWGIDLRKMLQKGQLPPYDVGASDEMEYRLLARKTFTSDLTYYNDDGADAGLTSVTEPLKIVWRWVFK